MVYSGPCATMYVHWDYGILHQARLLQQQQQQKQQQQQQKQQRRPLRQFHLMAMLRSPVARVVSEYFYCTGGQGSTCTAPQFDYDPGAALHANVHPHTDQVGYR